MPFRIWQASGLISLLVLSLILVACGEAPSSGTTGALPTATPAATATATSRDSHPISGATIGGTQNAFTARYGSPSTAPSGAPSYQTTLGSASVAIDLDGLVAGSDGQPRTDLMSLADPDGSAWDTSTSTAVVLQFLPPDARHIRDDQTPDVGTLHVYQSADLAATFPPSVFTNSGQGGGLEPPGTVSYTCDAPGTVGCTISLGE